MKKLILLVLMLPMVALSDPQPWMKKENPDELGFEFRYGVECGVPRMAVERMAKDVLVRSRIKVRLPPTYELPPAYEKYLFINLWCSDFQGKFVYRFDIDFMEISSGHGWIIRHGEISRGGYGLQTQEGLVNDIKNRLESFIADYLRANFDLGEDE